MTNENEKQRIYVGIDQPTHNASTSHDRTSASANGKGDAEELTSTSVDHSPARCSSQR
jgi:hypothetical protein